MVIFGKVVFLFLISVRVLQRNKPIVAIQINERLHSGNELT